MSKIVRLVPKQTPEAREDVLKALRDTLAAAERGEVDGIALIVIDGAGKPHPVMCGVADRGTLILGLSVIQAAIVNQVISEE